MGLKWRKKPNRSLHTRGNGLLLFVLPCRSTFLLLRVGGEAGIGINSTQGDADLCSDISSCSPASSSIGLNVGPRLANHVNEPNRRHPAPRLARSRGISPSPIPAAFRTNNTFAKRTGPVGICVRVKSHGKIPRGNISALLS